MNERIRELVVESGNGLMRDGKLYPHIGIRFEEDWQRFAELIVKEYEKLLPDICPWADAAKEGPMKGWHVQYVARKHFGVEE